MSVCAAVFSVPAVLLILPLGSCFSCLKSASRVSEVVRVSRTRYVFIIFITFLFFRVFHNFIPRNQDATCVTGVRFVLVYRHGWDGMENL